MFVHLSKVKNNSKYLGRNKHKINTIKNILNEGLEPIIIKLKESNNEKEILLEEFDLIDNIGRCDLGTGTLCNLTEGGEFNGNVSVEK